MKSLEEKTLSSTPAYQGKLVNLHVDTVLLPNGTQSIREIVRHPGAVAMVPVLPSGDVVLVRQFRHAARQVLLEIPAGTLEPGEDPVIAARRELQEEIGYKPGTLAPLGGEYTAPGYTTEYIHLYLATDLSESHLTQDDDEFLEVVTLPFDDALREVLSGSITDGKTQLGLLLAAHHLER